MKKNEPYFWKSCLHLVYTFHFWRRYFCFAATITSGVAISTSWLINDQMHHEVKERKNVLALVQKYSFPHHRCPATNQLAKCDAKPSCCLWLYFESNAKMAWFISFQGCRNLLKIVNRILVCIGIINLQLFKREYRLALLYLALFHHHHHWLFYANLIQKL